MKRSRVPWTAKLGPEMKPEVAPDPKGRGLMLFPTPLLVAETIAKIPTGSIITAAELRTRMAQQFEAEVTCPLMTRIFYNLVAGAAEEQIEAGRRRSHPTGAWSWRRAFSVPRLPPHRRIRRSIFAAKGIGSKRFAGSSASLTCHRKDARREVESIDARVRIA